jgi:hypothetical protein
MRERYHSPEGLFGEIPPTRRILQSSRNRLRSGSATTSASDSTDYEGPLSTSAPIHGSSGSSSQFSSHSSGSLPRAPPSNGTVLTPIPSSSNQGVLPPATVTSRLRSHQSSSSASTTSTQSSKPSIPSGTPSTANGRMTPQNGVVLGSSSTSISHFAARTLERDADAMAQYLMRARSSSSSSANNTPTASAHIPPQVSPFSSETAVGDLRGRNNLPRLKPSISATSLRTGSQATTPIATRPPGPSLPPDDSRANSRIRATTLNNVPGQTTATRSPPMPTSNLPGAPPGSPPAHRRPGFHAPSGKSSRKRASRDERQPRTPAVGLITQGDHYFEAQCPMIRDCPFVLYTSPILPILFLQPCYCSERFLTHLSVSFATYISNVVIFYHHVSRLRASVLIAHYTCPARRWLLHSEVCQKWG